MDNTKYTTEHKKNQHLLSEERHKIEVRLKDGWSPYRIAKHLGRPYNTIKNEIKRGTVALYNGKQHRYKADEGKKVYWEHRRNCRKQYRCLASVRFLQYVVEHFKSTDKWSLDASLAKLLQVVNSVERKWFVPKPSTTTWILVCFPSRTSICLKSLDVIPR